MIHDNAKVLRTGFYTIQSLGDKGCIRIDFKSLAELHQADDELRAFLAKPAELHQGEPVAWTTQRELEILKSGNVASVYPNDVLTKIPLYTHADPSDIRATKQALESLKGEASDLRAELTQLRSALKFYANRDHFSTDDGSNLDSCSGEPANILWHESEPWFIEDGSIARAALERKASDDIPTFTLGNGNKAERRATALLAQLQADLTARDNQNDQMRVLLQHLVYDYRAAIQAGYDKITGLGGDCDSVAKMLADNLNYQKAMALLLPDLESRPEERGTPETEPCSGCGTPGWTGACNKCVPY